MAIKSYRILNLLPCVTGGKKLLVVAAFDQEIGDLLPYCNAVLERAAYDPGRGTLTTRCYGRPVILSSRHVVVGQLTDPGLAEEILEAPKRFFKPGAGAKKTRLLPFMKPKSILPGSKSLFYCRVPIAPLAGSKTAWLLR